MRADLRDYAERAVKDAPKLTEEQVRRLALLLAPAVQKTGGRQ